MGALTAVSAVPEARLLTGVVWPYEVVRPHSKYHVVT